MSNHRSSLLGRFRSLLRGLFGGWLRDRENANPETVYEQAIEGRVRQYRELKDAVAGILYMRGKLEAEITERRAEIARLHDDIRRSVRRRREEISVTLIAHKQALFEDLERAESELQNVRSEAAEAKHNLVRFREEIRTLVREKSRMLATLANARARRRLHSALDGLSVDHEMAALESVREHVGRMTSEGQVEKELGDSGMRTRLRAFRDEARLEAARSELAQLQRDLGVSALAPGVEIEQAIPVATG